MKLSALFSPVVTFLKTAIQRLSQVDGKPGLTFGDIEALVQKAAALAHDGTNK